MRWELAHGTAYRARIAAGIAPLPQEIPEPLLPGASWLLSAFWEMSYDRPTGFGVGYLPSRTITDWLNEAGVSDRDQRELIRRALRAADHEFVAHCNKDGAGDSTVAETVMTTDLFDKLMGQ